MSKVREILISVKPQYANPIVDGIKTVELRKRFPLDLEIGTRLFIYSSFPEKKVIGECRVKKIERLPISILWNRYSSKALIEWEDFSSYFAGHEQGIAIHIHSEKRYKRPISLPEVNPDITQAPQSYRYLPQ